MNSSHHHTSSQIIKKLSVTVLIIFLGTLFTLILAGKTLSIDTKNTSQNPNQALLKLSQPSEITEFSQLINSSGGKVLKSDKTSGIMLIELDYKLQTAQFLNSPNLELIEPLKEAASGKQESKISKKVKEKIEATEKANVIISFTDPVAIGSERIVRKFAVKHYRDEILQNIPRDKFEIKNIFDYVPAISGFITKEGINVLENNTLVESINLIKQTKIISAESIPLIKADLVHAAPYELTGKGMTVAILDTGADTDHPDFTSDNAIEDEKCFTSDIYDDQEPPQLISTADCQGPNPTEGDIAEDFHGHGTNVAGIITAPSGFAPDAGIVPIRVTNDAGFGVESDWLRALDWVIANQNELSIDTINISMEVQNADGTGIFYSDHATCDNDYTAMLSSISQLNLLGITVFAGTGNRGNQTGISSPACLSNVIAVGATYDTDLGREPNVGTYRDPGTGDPNIRWADCYDTQSYDIANNRPYIACFSNTSTNLNNIIMAPGVKITSTNLGGGQSEWYGTSQSSPAAVSIGTLMQQADSTLTTNEIKILSLNTGSSVYTESGIDEFKLINAQLAIDGVIPAECQNVTDVPEVECNALKRLYDSSGGPTWTSSTNWLTTSTVCGWFGITCANGHVTGINLSSNNLVGIVPEELQNIKQLTGLNLNDNHLENKIPGQIGNLLNLELLDLGINKLDKTIPENLKNLTSLLTLDLSSNKLNGEIPASFVNLASLTAMDIGYNKLAANDPGLITFLDGKDPDWDETQTIAPSNVQAGGTFENNGITVSWDTINYKGDGGYYQVSYSGTSGGPYTLGCTTADKTENSCEIINLTPDTGYHFVVQSFTPLHEIQQNDLLSDYSSEIQDTTPFVHYVTIDGNCNGALPCYSSIQTAVDTANNNEMVKVAAGIYSEGAKQVVQIIDKGIFIAGGYSIVNWNLYDPVTNETILDAENVSDKRGITVLGTGGYDLLVKGFTVKNGNIVNDNGGGVYIWDGKVILEDSKIINNSTSGPRLSFGNGGGVCILHGEVTLKNNIIEGNTAYEGGGIYVGEDSLDVTILGNQIRNNHLHNGGEYGGGIKAGGRSGAYVGINNKLAIKDNLIENNSSDLGGGGIIIFGADANANIIEITGNTINSNTSSENGAGLNIGPRGIYLIEDNTINGNIATGTQTVIGGGIFFNHTITATANNNEITNNVSSGGGGGIGINPVDYYIPSDDINLDKNVIRNNTSAIGGGGIELKFIGDMIAKRIYLSNNIIVDNNVTGGGAEILAFRGDIVARNNTLSGNNEYGLQILSSGTAQIYNSIVEGYSIAGIHGNGLFGIHMLYHNNTKNFDGGATTNVFLEGDPKFIDALNNDYHLDVGSPAIDAGSNYGIFEDIDGDTRPLGLSYDIEADEFFSPACSVITEIPLAECEALTDLYVSTNGAEWTDRSNWLHTNFPCSWYGVTCTTGNVTSINLSYNNLSGTIAPEIQNLAFLNSLLLNGNSLSGTIPAEIGNLGGAISTLNLSNNKLEGEIPLGLTNLSNLSTLGLGYNKLESTNQTVVDFLAVNDPDWDQTQTAPPANIKIRVNSDHSLNVSFLPITYTADGGYYRVNYSTLPGGPYDTPGCQTADKTGTNCDTSIMPEEVKYYFAVQTFTPSHTNQPNNLWSRDSDEFEVFIIPDKDSLIYHINETNGTGGPVYFYLSPQTHQFDLFEGIGGQEENGLPAITSDITIIGSGATVQRDNSSLNSPFFRIFNVGSTGKLKLEDLSIKSGDLDSGGGAGIRNEGELVLDSVTLSQNISETGGAVLNLGTAAIINSNISYNLSFGSGGGIKNDSGANLTIIESYINENIAGSGGGGLSNSGTVNITDTEIKNNLGASGGGVSNGGSVSLSGSTVIGNTTIAPNLENDPETGICNFEDPYKGGGVCNYGTLDVTGSKLLSNSSISSAGALYNDSTAGNTTISNSCILSNAATINDAILNESVSTVDATANWWGYAAGPTPPEVIGGNVDTGSPLAASILGCPSGMVHDEVSTVKDLQTLPYEDNEFIGTDLQPLGQFTPSCATGLTKGIYYQVTDDKALAETIIGRARIGGIIGRSRIGGIIGRARIGGIIGRARIGGIIGQDKYRFNVSGEDFTPVVSVFADDGFGYLEEISCSEGLNYLTELEVTLNPGNDHYIVLGFRDGDDGDVEIKTESLHNQLPVEVVDYTLTPEGGIPDNYYLEISLLNVRDYDLTNLQIQLIVDENTDKMVVVDETALIASILKGQTETTVTQLQIQFTPAYAIGDAVKFYVEITEDMFIGGELRSVTSTVPIIIPQKLKFELWDFDDEQEITSLPLFPPTSDPRYMDTELLGLEEYAVRWLEDVDIPYSPYYSITREKGGELSEQFYNRMVGQISGYFNAELTGMYEFYMRVEDGAKLLIDDVTIIDDTGPRLMNDGSVMGSISLSEGWHKFEVQYFEDLGGNGLQMEYKDPSMGNPEVIPTELFLSQPPETQSYDFGDAPYPSATHLIDGTTYLGSCVDSEVIGLVNADANGDDIYQGNITVGTCSGPGDDEDGVRFNPPLEPGGTTYIYAYASTSGYLSAWFDFNQDGDWEDTGENVYKDEPLTIGINSLLFDVPGDAALGDTYARFRFSQGGGLDYQGIAGDGEVEDYKVEFIAYDYGDAPNSLTTKTSDYPTFAESAEVSWAKSASSGNYHDAFGRGIAIDMQGNSYITGAFGDSIVFGEGSAEITLLSSGYDLFLAKYDNSGTFIWAKNAGPVGAHNGGYDITLDDEGNSYLTGRFSGIATFDSIVLTSAGNEDIFVAKYDNSGNVVWAKSAGGSGNDGANFSAGANRIAVDSAGNIYVTATFEGTVTFGSTVLTSAGNEDIFVAKYDNSGNVTWAKSIGGIDSDGSWGIAIALDNVGNIYVTGSFKKTATFGSTTFTSVGDEDFFVAKYDINGNEIWVKTAGYLEADSGKGITVDEAGNIYVLGLHHTYDYTQEPITFGEGSNQITFHGWGLFLIKYNSEGTLIWGKYMGPPYNRGSIEGKDITADAFGNIYITVRATDYIRLGEGEAGEIDISGNIVAKYRSDGSLAWAKSEASGGTASIPSIAVDEPGNIYITGDFDGIAYFGEDENEIILDNPGSNVYVAKYNGASFGAGHFLDGVTYIGDCIDSEISGLSTTISDGDDKYTGYKTIGICSRPGDDEDGVTFDAPLPIGLTSTIDVKASTPGNLSAWIDFNADGDWADTGEQIFADEVLSPGMNPLSFDIPESTIEGYSHARFRFSTDAGLSYEGYANNGEVEDYKISFIYAYDYGDAPDPLPDGAYPTLTLKNHQIDWAKSAGGSRSDSPLAIDVDNYGNSYVTGRIYRPAEFGAISLMYNPAGTDMHYMFVAKYDKNGSPVWAKSAFTPCCYSGTSVGYDISVDGIGNIYVTGNHDGYVFLGEPGDPNPARLSTHSEDNNYFIAKYDSDGTLLWERTWSSTSSSAYGIVEFDSAGNSYITGHFSGTATTFNSTSSYDSMTLTSLGSNDIFLVKYNSWGDLQWAKNAGGTDSDEGHGIAVDATGNSYVTGYFSGTATFGTITLTSNGSYDIFATKYDNNGAVIWAKSAGGSGWNEGKGIAVGDSSNSYVTGEFEETVVFGEGEINETTLTSQGSRDIFVAKYNIDGDLAWAKSAGGSGYDYGGPEVIADSSGNVTVAGEYDTSAVFRAGEFNEITLNGPYPGDISFIAKYDDAGSLIWAANTEFTDQTINGQAISPSGDIYITDAFTGTLNLGPYTLTSLGGSSDIFVAKYSSIGPSAHHLMNKSIYLGNCVDGEPDGQTTLKADGDDTNAGEIIAGTCSAAGDDDDGVIFGELKKGNNVNVEVLASSSGNLSAWIDWNFDGDWEDTAEQIFADQLLTPGTNNLIISVPPDAIDADTFARFRFSSNTNLGYSGAASDGEVEDYEVSVFLDPALTLTIDQTNIPENGGLSNVTVKRNTGLLGDLTVNLASDDTSEAAVPVSVNIYDGTNAAAFTITAVDDDLSDGTKTVMITASAAGFFDGTGTIDITDDEVPALEVSIDQASISENGGNATGTIFRNTEDLSQPLTVNLTSDDSGEATVPLTVTIPDGSDTVTFPITAVDDIFADGTQTVTITASTTGFVSGTDIIDVTDDDAPALTLSIDQASIPENRGSATGTISRNTEDISQPLTVDLFSSDESEALAVEIFLSESFEEGFPPAGWIERDVSGTYGDWTAYTDTRYPPGGGVQDGTYLALFNSSYEAWNQTRLETSALDFTGRFSVKLSFWMYHDTWFSEKNDRLQVQVDSGGGFEDVGIEILRYDGTTGWKEHTLDLSAYDNQSNIKLGFLGKSRGGRDIHIDNIKLISPAIGPQATIPAGQTSITFYIMAVDDALPDGYQTVTITASAAGYVDGTDTIDVTDDDTLTLTIDQASIPENGGSTTGTISRNNEDISKLLTVSLLSSDESEVITSGSVNFMYESFEGAFPPAGWTITDINYADGNWEQLTDTRYPSGGGVQDGTYLAYFNSATARAGSKTRLETSALDSTGKFSVDLSLWMYHDTLATWADRLQVQVDNGGGFVDVGGEISRYSGTAGWKEHTVDLSAYANQSNLKLGFLGISSGGNDIHIDNINLTGLVSSQVTIPAGQRSTTFDIMAVDDAIPDGTQTVTITASATGYVDGTDTIDVTDDETTTLNISTVTESVPEGGQLQYEAQINTVAEFDVIVDYTITGIGLNPADGTDFAGGSTGQVTITAGNASAPISLDILADGADEVEEELTVTLTVNPSTTGSVTEGTLSATGIITNLAPSASAGSIPADGETRVSAMQKLSWMPGIDPDNNTQTYDLYLDANPTPTTLLAAGLIDNFYQPALLTYNQTYYWRIDITDYAGNVTTGDVWSFITESSSQAECPGLGIICNPSFEFGTDHWTANGDTDMITSTDAYDGLESISSEQLRTSAQNPRWAGFSQENITGFEAGETYNLQIHAKGTNITQGHVKIKWYDAASTVITTTYPLTGIEGTISNWTWYNRVFTVPNDAVTAEFAVWHGVTPAVPPQNFAGSTLLIDKILWQPATEYCGTVCNENFEAGLLFWTQQGKPGSNTVQTTGAKDGTKFIRSEQLYTSADPLQWTGIRQIAEVTEGQVYNLRMWFKSENAEGGHVRLTWKDQQGKNISTIYPVTGITGTNTTWLKKEATLTPPVNAAKAELIILHGVNVTPQNSAGSTLWVDNITMICTSLCNGGFENGMDDWGINGYKDVTIETSYIQEGTKAVLLEQDATNADNVQWSGINQRVKVTGGNSYEVSLWLKKLSAVQGHVKVTWRDPDDNFISNSFPATGIEGTDATWAQYRMQFTAPINADTAEIYVWHGVQQGIGNMTASRLWVDNVTLICLSLCNPGFEKGKAYWETTGTNETEIITSDAQEGTQAIKIAQNLAPEGPAEWTGISQKILVTGGITYDFSFWMKKENLVNGHVKVRWYDQSDNFISQQFPLNGMTGTDLTWVQQTITLNAPANAAEVEIFMLHGVDMGNQNATGSTLYVDNVGFVQQ